MISKFLSSRFSGYLAIIAVVAVLGMVFYIYREGKKACVGAIASKQVEITRKSVEGANDVRRVEQGFDTDELDRQLCGIGIVRGGTGCK